MDQIYLQIRSDLASNDGMRQAQALIFALQHAAAGRDISSLSKAACDDIIASPASALCKKLAFDLIRNTRLNADQWETVCRAIRNDLVFPDPDVTAAAVSCLASVPSWRLGKLLIDCSKEISSCIVSDNANLRYAVVESLGCVLPRDDAVALCAASAAMQEIVVSWWTQLAQSMLDECDAVSWIAFAAVGRLFHEYESKQLSRCAGEKLAPGEAVVAIRSCWVAAVCRFVWENRNTLMARSLVLPLENMRATVFPLVFAVKAVATSMVAKMQILSGPGGIPSRPQETRAFEHAERILGVSDVVSHFLPFFSALEPALLYEIGINLLSLADVSGSKPEWAAAPVVALLSLWDRQEFSAGREAIVRAVVKYLHLIDVNLQVSLFKRLLIMVRNLRLEADRMDALASICRTALSVDLFTKESVRRGQKPLPGTDIVSLFEEVQIKDEMFVTTSTSVFREELVACLVESCLRLSLPPLKTNASREKSTAVGALYGAGYQLSSWMQTALEVVEVCRPCVRWDCQGRTYAMDSYLKLLVKLCCVYNTVGGGKKTKNVASPEQVLAEIRLAALQRELVKDLAEVPSSRMRPRIVWALAEHFDLESLDPLLADDPDDPLNILIDNLHKVLFNADGAVSAATNRLQDVQAALLCAQHMGSRNVRAQQLLTKELEDFRNSIFADSVNKHQCRLVLQVFRYIAKHPESRWIGVAPETGDYPFSHHKLSVQYFDSSAAQDRKLEDLVHTAVEKLWRPQPTELELVTCGNSPLVQLKSPPSGSCLSGSGDPCYLEAYHLTDASERRLTLHLRVINLTELELNRVDVHIGLGGPLCFMDSGVQVVRELQKLASQDPIMLSMTVGVSKFERCSFRVRTSLFPYHGLNTISNEDEHTATDDDSLQGVRQRRSIRPESGEPVIIRCQSYRVPLVELLLPRKCSPVEFFRMWPSLPATAEFTGVYTFDRGGLISSFANSSDPSFLVGLLSLSLKPFHRVCTHVLRSVGGFQLCYSSRTWYGDFLGMVIIGTSDIDGGVNLDGERQTTMCKFVLGASSGRILDEISSELQDWLDDVSSGVLRVVTDAELKVVVENKVPRSTGKQDRSRPSVSFSPVKSKSGTVYGGNLEALPASLEAEEMEHRALQAAVLEQWEGFQ